MDFLAFSCAIIAVRNANYTNTTELNAELKIVEAKFMADNGFAVRGDSSGRWKNANMVFEYSGNRLFCQQDYELNYETTYLDIDGNEYPIPDNPDDPPQRFITENIAKVPEFARFFELLKVVYSLQPIAQLAVAHGAIPDFAKMSTPYFVETPDAFPANFNYCLPDSPKYAGYTPQDILEELDVGFTKNMSLGLGTAYTINLPEYDTPARRNDNLTTDRKVICPLIASIHNEEYHLSKEDRDNRDVKYESDENWRSTLRLAGEKFYALKGGGATFVTDEAGLKEFYEKYPNATAEIIMNISRSGKIGRNIQTYDASWWNMFLKLIHGYLRAELKLTQITAKKVVASNNSAQKTTKIFLELLAVLQ